MKTWLNQCFNLFFPPSFSFLLMTEPSPQSFKTIIHTLWDFTAQCRALALVHNTDSAKISDPFSVISTTTFSPSEPVWWQTTQGYLVQRQNMRPPTQIPGDRTPENRWEAQIELLKSFYKVIGALKKKIFPNGISFCCHRNNSPLFIPSDASFHYQQSPQPKNFWGSSILQRQQLPQRNWLVRRMTKTRCSFLIHGKSQWSNSRSRCDIALITGWIRYAWNYQTQRESNW